jgi:hypothetical protein
VWLEEVQSSKLKVEKSEEKNKLNAEAQSSQRRKKTQDPGTKPNLGRPKNLRAKPGEPRAFGV